MEYALIVAGGKGLRMGTDLPKQFLPIGGKPVLMRTLEAFYACNAEIQIILVLPHSQQDYWRQLCKEYCFSLPHVIADGGEEYLTFLNVVRIPACHLKFPQIGRAHV